MPPNIWPPAPNLPDPSAKARPRLPSWRCWYDVCACVIIGYLAFAQAQRHVWGYVAFLLLMLAVIGRSTWHDWSAWRVSRRENRS